MSKRLEKIESRLQMLVEGAGKLFSSGERTESFSEQIIACMRENSRPDASGLLSAPERYLVEVNPGTDPARVFDDADINQIITDMAAAAAADGIMLPRRPEILVRVNPELAPKTIKISPSRQEEKSGHTASVSILEGPENEITIPQGAFLIINGSETIQLQKPVVNIGRRSNNDVVVNDPRVSREHAQLRIKNGGYVVFDLQSRGGTFVNNLPVTQKELIPGDVISLAGVPVIYGHESGGALHEPLDRTPTSQLAGKKPGGGK